MEKSTGSKSEQIKSNQEGKREQKDERGEREDWRGNPTKEIGNKSKTSEEHSTSIALMLQTPWTGE